MDSGARLFDGGNRAFSYAVLCSIVLHGLLLLALPSLRDSSKRADAHPGLIIARLSPLQPAPAAPSPPKSEPPPAPRVEESRPPAPVTKPAPAPKPVPLAKAQKAPAKPAQAAPTPASPSAPASETPPAQAPSAPAAPAAAKSESPAAATPLAASPETADAGTLAQYRLQLISVAKRYKRYPRVAMDNNWEGTADIRMVIGANGMIASLVVRKGSGHEVLDQEAVQWIRKAKPLAPIPAALRGKEFTVDIPVIFNLKEPGA